MSRLDDVTSAWLQKAEAAADRWKDRTKRRGDIKHSLETAGPGAADDPEIVAQYLARATGRRTRRAINPTPISEDIRAERILGVDNRIRFPETEEERDAGLPVARIVVMPTSTRPLQGFGSGFMITPSLLMTNHHVLAAPGDANGVGANFGHDYTDSNNAAPGELFELRPDRFFLSDEALDFAIVAVAETGRSSRSLSDFGHHPLIEQTGKILIGKPINIIQHPSGGPKMFANKDNDLLDRLDDFLHYRTDTKPGSSGSPCFNDFWEVVALHHSGVPATDSRGRFLDDQGKVWRKQQGTEAIHWIANEGVRISRILARVRAETITDPEWDRLRDEIFAIGTMADETGGGVMVPPGQNAVDIDLAPGSQSGSDPAPVIASGGSGAEAGRAQTVVHVHGPANVYTAPVHTHEAARAESSEGGMESTSGPTVLEKVLRFDPHYGRRRGYQRNFLDGFSIPLPEVHASRKRELVTERHGRPLILDYHHFSLAMNRKWLLQMWSAVNVDYSPKVRWDLGRQDFGSDKWIHDPRISEALQIDNKELYKPAKKFDRGHVVRRDDNVWGVTREEVEYANSDTFHWTNCTPQHENFNRSNKQGVWGKLENHVAEQADAIGGKLILFSGPVLDPDRAIPHDFGGGRFLVPLDFWKVAIVAEEGEDDAGHTLRAYGFLLEQEEAIDTKGLEKLSLEKRFDIGEFAPQQRSLKVVQARTGIVLPEIVCDADVMIDAEDDAVLPLRELESVKLRS